MMPTILSSDPRTGRSVPTAMMETSREDVHEACVHAKKAASSFEGLGRVARAAILNSLADALEVNRDAIVATADDETALGHVRLNGELTRTAYQFRLFAEALLEGSYVEAIIDPAGETGMGIRPDLRRMLVPIGPVGVFGASNFPLAFSVPGGDTASALASGCPVIVKAHSAHPRTSQLCFEVLREALIRMGAPAATLQIVFGRDAGIVLVAEPEIRAIGFTGSLAGGKAILDVIERRDNPIPFYGELSGLNPVIVTPRAAEDRTADIAKGLVTSFTLGAGQFCTKPGLAFIPSTRAGDDLVSQMIDEVKYRSAEFLLNSGIASSYEASMRELSKEPGVRLIACGEPAASQGFSASPHLFTVNAAELTETSAQECFGPVCLIVRYDDAESLVTALNILPSSLTTTIHCSNDECELPTRVEHAMRDLTGRFVFNAYPTGVSVAWAQHHGGPWPSTNSIHTSVGVTALRRFLRPVAWQSAPQALLPLELRDDFFNIPRRVDGKIVLPV